MDIQHRLLLMDATQNIRYRYFYLLVFVSIYCHTESGLPRLTTMVNQLGVPAWIESVIHSL